AGRCENGDSPSLFHRAPMSDWDVFWQKTPYHVDCSHPRPLLSFCPTHSGQEISMKLAVQGVSIPDSRLAHEITEMVRDTESPLLFHHSSRVYYWAALAGRRRDLRLDAELLYAGAMFHDMGLTHRHSSLTERFEVDGANAARDFLRSRGIGLQDIDTV